jgi:hypothetical protein
MCSDCDGLDEDPVLVRQWLDQQDAWYRDTIRTFGWAIQHVCGDGEGSPSVAYTVGLTGFGHPEIAVFGVGQTSAATLLNTLGEQVRSGASLHDGDVIHVRCVPVTLFELPNPGDVLFTANSVYGRRNDNSVPALQAVYPDNDGAWPWEPAYELAPWLQPMPGQFQA